MPTIVNESEITLTSTLTAEIELMIGFFPYRIIWVLKDKDTGETTVKTSYTRRSMNDAIRKGHTVALVTR